MSKHRHAGDTPANTSRVNKQRAILEKMGWTVAKRKPRGWKLISPDKKKVIRVGCCLQRALSQALAYEATRK